MCQKRNTLMIIMLLIFAIQILPTGTNNPLSVFEKASAFPGYDPIILSSDIESNISSVRDSWIEVNSTVYNFTVDIYHPVSWNNITFINITGWYDFGNESTYYNYTTGANLNFFFSYNNSDGTFTLVYPSSGEVTFLGGSVYRSNVTTAIANISFIPGPQFAYANGSGNLGPYNDPYSWNYLINVTDEDNFTTASGEFGVMKYMSLYVSDVTPYIENTLPGTYDITNIFTIRESSNHPYYLNVTIYGNLTTKGLNYTPIGVENIFIEGAVNTGKDNNNNTFYNVTASNPFAWNNLTKCLKNTNVQKNGTFQRVNDIRFKVYVPLGTLGGTYSTYISFKLSSKNGAIL